MKKRLVLFALAAVDTACQQPAPPAVTVAHRPAAAPLLAATARLPATDDSLAPEAATLLRQHDLSPLWASQTENTKAHPTLEGFYGPAYYRISFYFSKIYRDARQPNVFHVQGLDRYKKAVTPFTGTITVQTMRPFAKDMYADLDSTWQSFTAAGQFEFIEDPTTKGAGRYAGQALLDFALDAQGSLDYAGDASGLASANPTKGCGLLFRGTQVSNRTGQRHSVAFANYYGAVVPQALAKLHLGDRSEEINPNMAKLGWNEAWENDEWWATTPKLSLSL
jgi:hypothetical protein